MPTSKEWADYLRENKNLNDYTKEVHEANAKWWVCLRCLGTKGFIAATSYGTDYTNPQPQALAVLLKCPDCVEGKAKRNIGEMLALMHSELSEGLEGWRKGLKDDKLPQYEMLDVELIDCVIRIFDLLGSRGVDAEEIYQAKNGF